MLNLQGKDSTEMPEIYLAEPSDEISPHSSSRPTPDYRHGELSQEHKDYPLKRHGTLDLDPLPTSDEHDPYNWPNWKKVTNLILVVIHASMSTFTAAVIIPAYDAIAQDLGVSLQQASYLTTIPISLFAIAPLTWKPFCNVYGRRPILLLSLICSLAGNVGCAMSPSYATMALCRAIVAYFISPAAAIGSAVVTETFFKRNRARYMGIWTLMTMLGVPIGPLVMGFVTSAVGYRWVYWILTIINGFQLVTYFFLGPETRYIRHDMPAVVQNGTTFKQEFLNFKRIDPSPLKLRDFIHPLGLWGNGCVVIPVIAHAITFAFANTLIAVEIPELFSAKFGMNASQLGLKFLGMIIGSVIGEQIGGSLSDYWMNRRERKTKSKTPPEYRLWLSYPGFILTIVGIIVFLVQIEQATPGTSSKWNITPVIGIAIAGGGNQIVTTVLITYAIDCYQEDPASVGVFVTFVRQLWAFLGPFWFPPMFSSIGIAACSGISTALILGVSLLPTALLHLCGRRWRGEGKDIPPISDSEQFPSGSSTTANG